MVSRLFQVTAGVLLGLIGGAIGWLAIQSVIGGEAWLSSKHGHIVHASRATQAFQFWLIVTIYVVLAAFLAGLGGLFLVRAFRSRRSHRASKTPQSSHGKRQEGDRG
jgi:heme/copper-type cytochrome/quinol oxidase subunit 2